ncbi:CBS domain-containing protein [Tepidibacter formicigenes]|jgi:CBS domain-containing protein|uniref:CBS domain-containing protein n=1 Tax=Tepidibacter formicigenes DSM 15518 TaxID=1123349 RepID=A0A1M6JXY4_9FIRM|nr:CBS domain-containing protein [Tepidibacter formicigenes]SHJ51565.1 CBS domain-containing protein [Tepidibacter formicigenes DSM 15518]
MLTSKIMNYYVISINTKTSIGEALDIMEKNNINGLPVVDDYKNLKGIIVKTDIYRFLMYEGHNKAYPVELAMTKNVLSVNKDEDIYSVGKKLREKNIIAMPVVDDNKVVGIISIEDILDYLLKNTVK